MDAEGSQLVVGARVSSCASDRNELVADVDAVPESVGGPARVLADNGYATGSEVAELESRDMEVLVAVGRGGRRRAHDFRPPVKDKPVREPKAAWRQRMKKKLESQEGRAHYRLRKHTVGAGVRDREGGDGVPAVPAAEFAESGGRVGPGDAGVQLPASERAKDAVARVVEPTAPAREASPGCCTTSGGG